MKQRLIPAKGQNRKSFYGKAHFVDSLDRVELFSYGTHVATYDKVNGVLNVYSYMSKTTTEHIVAFADLVFGSINDFNDYELLLKERPDLFG